VSAALVPLAALMAAVTYPSRALPLLAPGFERLPPRVLEDLRLVGPAVLASLAAVNAAVILDAVRRPSFHVGVEWLAVAIVVLVVRAGRGLFLGLVVAVSLAAAIRGLGLA
jgi:branched-subunit amino acid transport protein